MSQVPPIPPLPEDIPPPPWLIPTRGEYAWRRCWYRLSGASKVLLRPLTSCCDQPTQHDPERDAPVCPSCGDEQPFIRDFEVRPRKEFRFELDGV